MKIHIPHEPFLRRNKTKIRINEHELFLHKVGIQVVQLTEDRVRLRWQNKTHTFHLAGLTLGRLLRDIGFFTGRLPDSIIVRDRRYKIQKDNTKW